MRGPIRVLHAVGGLNRGGTETWLVKTLKYLDQSRFSFTFLKTDRGPHSYDNDVCELGASIVVCESPRRLTNFIPALARTIRDGKFDVVHSHLHLYSGIVLATAAACGVGVRVAHAHTDTQSDPRELRLWRRAYARVMHCCLNVSMTHGLAVSPSSAENLFGKRLSSDARVAHFSCGVDLAPFQRSVAREEVRRSLGIPLEARVLGHVGRFEPPKNHAFLMTLAKALMEQDDRVWLFLAGDGALLPRIRTLASSLGIEHRVLFAGSISNVPEVLLGAVDAFVFPSIWEGLGLAVVEAQAAGLPCVVSSAVPPNAVVVPASVRALPPGAALSDWTAATWSALHQPRLSANEALSKIVGGPFDIAHSAERLCEFYERALDEQ